MVFESDKSYWDQTWKDRTGDTVKMNAGKFMHLIDVLWSKPHFAIKNKLDVGCGTGIHAHFLSLFNPLWKTRWTGIDLAESAIAKAKTFGLEAHVSDLLDYKTEKRFNLFLFLDVLEHIEDHEAIGKKIKDLASDNYTIYGNCPLYLSDNDHERIINVNTIARFLAAAGCNGGLKPVVYGINGFPYITFEATSTGKFESWMDIIPSLVKAK